MKLLKIIIIKLLLFTYNTVQPPFMGYHAQAKTKINRKKRLVEKANCAKSVNKDTQYNTRRRRRYVRKAG